MENTDLHRETIDVSNGCDHEDYLTSPLYTPWMPPPFENIRDCMNKCQCIHSKSYQYFKSSLLFMSFCGAGPLSV